MSFLVNSYNIDSGWKVGELLSKAATEAEAVAEASKNLGVEGLTQFRHVVTEVADVAEETAEPPAAEKSEPEPVPHVEVTADPADELVSLFKGVEPSVLARVIAKLNSALGG